jgi:hypothetical protein
VVVVTVLPESVPQELPEHDVPASAQETPWLAVSLDKVAVKALVWLCATMTELFGDTDTAIAGFVGVLLLLPPHARNDNMSMRMMGKDNHFMMNSSEQ